METINRKNLFFVVLFSYDNVALLLNYSTYFFGFLYTIKMLDVDHFNMYYFYYFKFLTSDKHVFSNL